MSDYSAHIGDPISNINKVKHESAQRQNPSGEPSGRDYLTPNIKYWIVLPALAFQTIGIIILVFITLHFFENHPISPYPWLALIAALAGIPFGFAANIRKLIDAFTISSN